MTSHADYLVRATAFRNTMRARLAAAEAEAFAHAVAVPTVKKSTVHS